jgi:hypothetical protein
MLRTVFTIGLFAVLGLIALKLAFGLFGTLLGLFIGLAIMAVKVLIVGLVIYFAIRIISPDTARRLRERWSGPAV